MLGSFIRFARRGTKPAVFAGLCLALLCTACSDEAADHTDHGDSAPAPRAEGVIYIDNPAEGLWAGSSDASLRFDATGIFGSADPSSDAHLGSLAGAVVDNDGNVYAFDGATLELVAFDADGAVRWRRGQQGSAPEEFDDVRGMAFDGVDAIYLVNQNGTRLDSWTTDGSLRPSILLADLDVGDVYMGGFLEPRLIALIADDIHTSATNRYVVVQLDDPPHVAATFAVSIEPPLPIPPGIVLQLPHAFDDGRLLVGGWTPYALRVFDDRGRLLRQVSRDVQYLRRPGFAQIGARYAGVALGGLGAPLVLSSGHWLVVASWPTNVAIPNTFAEIPISDRPPIEWASSIDLFAADGRFLTSVITAAAQIPAIGRPWAAGPDNLVYTVSTEPFPQIRRYRTIITPPASQ